MVNSTKPINPFSPDYQSQLVPFKPTPFKLEALTQYPRNCQDNIAPNEDGKRARLWKSDI